MKLEFIVSIWILVLVTLTAAQSRTLIALGPTKDSQGNPVVPCYSDFDGYRMNGEEWITVSGFWKARCNNGTSQIIGEYGTEKRNISFSLHWHTTVQFC